MWLWKRVLLVLAFGCYKNNQNEWTCSCKNSRAVEPAALEQHEHDTLRELVKDHIGFSYWD